MNGPERILVVSIAVLLVALPTVAPNGNVGSTPVTRPELVWTVGHTGMVMSAAFAPQGDLLATGSHDATVKLWDPKTGELKRTLEGNTLIVWMLAWSPQGDVLATVSGDETLQIWDPRAGVRLKQIDVNVVVKSVVFSRDGQTLITGDESKLIKFWDRNTGQLLRTLSGHDGDVRTLAVSPDGTWLASGGLDRTVRIWELPTGELRHVLRGHPDTVNSVAISPDGQQLTAGCFDGSLWTWDPVSGESLRNVKGHRIMVRQVAYTPDGSSLLSGSWDHTVKLWNPATGELKQTIATVASRVQCLDISRDGKQVVVGTAENTVQLFELPSGAPGVMLGHFRGVKSIAYLPDNRYLAAGCADGVVRIWNTESGDLHRLLPVMRSVVTAMPNALIRGGKGLAAGTPEGKVILFDLERDAPPQTLSIQGAVYSVAATRDGQLLAAGTDDGWLTVWDVSTAEVRYSKQLLATVYGVALSSNGEWLAAAHGANSLTGVGDAGATLVNLRTGQTSSLKTAARSVSVAFSDEGHTLALGGHSQRVLMLDVATGTELRQLQGCTDFVNTVGFGPDADSVTALTDANSIHVWNWRTGEPTLVTRLERGRAIGKCFSYSADRKLLAVGGLDGGVKIRETANHRLRATLLSLPPRGTDAISTDYLTYTDQGFYLGSAGASHLLQWRVGRELNPVEAYERALHRPDLIRRALRGEELPVSQRIVQRFLAGDLVPPQVSFTTPRDGAEVFDDTVTVALKIAGGSDLKRVQMFVNGRLFKSSETATQFRVPMPPGEPSIKLKAIAFDEDELAGQHEIVLHRRVSGQVAGTLHVLAVGVSKYKLDRLYLRFAARDAQAFAALWASSEGKVYRRVRTQTLVDEGATANHLRAELNRLESTATEQDTVMLFLAGHGLQRRGADDEAAAFYFATHDVTPSLLTADSALPWTELQALLVKARAKRVLLFLDACHSGDTLGGDRGNVERMAELLVKRGGVMVFASSRGTEFSYELDTHQHGAFTAALLEALRDGQAGGRNGEVTPIKLLAYLQERVPELTNNRQTPVSPLIRDNFGEPFTLARVTPGK